MGASTTLIGVLPTYAMIGILAPILLVALRLVQGFGAGAEIAGATVMLAEYAPVKRRGLIASLVSLGTNSGTLAASGLWAILLAVLSRGATAQLGLAPAVPAELRAADLRGLAAPEPQGEPGLRGAARRRRRCRDVPRPRSRPLAAETHDERSRGRAPKQRKGKAFFLALGLRFGQAGNSGLVQTFLVGYIATTLLVDQVGARPARSCTAPCSGFVTVPVVGLLGDRFGRRPIYIALTLLTVAFAFPMMLMITSGSTPP